MKSKLLLWLLLCSGSAWAQLPVTESFEAPNGDYGYTSNTFTRNTVNPSTEYFIRAQNTVPGFGNPAGSADMLNVNGTYFWACEGVRSRVSNTVPDAGSVPGIVTLAAINNTQNYTNLKVIVAAGDPRSGTNIARETDHLRVRYAYGDPNGPYNTLFEFTGSNPGGSSSWTRVARLGTNVTGTASILSSTFSDHESTIPAGSGALYIRIEADYQGPNKEVAFDNIRVTGTASTVVKPTITSNVGTSTLTFAEGTTTALTVFSDLTVGNPAMASNPTLTGATVTLNPYAGVQDELTYTIPGGSNITLTSNSNGVLTFSGSSSVGNYKTLLQTVKYKNTEVSNATAGDRTLTFVVRDGTAESIPLSRIITVTTALNAASAPPRIEDFDTDGEGTRYGSNTRVAVQQGFVRLTNASGGSATPGSGFSNGATTTFTNVQGPGYWYVNGAQAQIVTGGVGVLTLAPVNSTGFSNLRFNIKAGATTNFGGTNDFLRFSYSTDGTSWTVFANYLNDGGVLRLNGNAANPGLTTTLADLDFTLPTSLAGTALRFRVEGSSGGGEQMAFDYIQITGTQQPTVSTGTAGSIAVTTASVSNNTLTADGGANISDYGVVYVAGTGTPTTSNSKVQVGTTSPGSFPTNFTANLLGLTAGTQYTARAYATNSAGTSYGSVVGFTTTPNAPVVTAPGNNSLVNTPTPTYSGTSQPGSTVAVYVDGSSIGTTTATGGNWSLAQSTSLTQGTHTVYATAQVTGSAASANANAITFLVDSVSPTLVISSGTATGTITACQGTASVSPAVQQFSVSGSNLTANLVATAPTNFEISTNAGSGFGTTATLTQSGGTVNNTPIYVRSSASASGSISGTVQLTSTGATAQTVAVSGTVNALPSVRITPNPSLMICSGQSTTLTASAGASYTWNTTQTTQAISVSASGPYSVTVNAASGCSNTATASVTVTPQVSITVIDASASEAGSDDATFRISIDQATSTPISVSYTLDGTASAADYTPTLTGSATIQTGNTYVDVVITPVDDARVEGSETIRLQLVSITDCPLGNPSSATATITDNDVAYLTVDPQVATISEGVGTYVSNVRLRLLTMPATGGSMAQSTTVTMGSTNLSTAPADFSLLTTTLVFPANAVDNATQSFSVAIVDDNLAEGAEFFDITILSAASSSGTPLIPNDTGYPFTGGPRRNRQTVQILDNDVPVLTVSGNGQTIVNGSTNPSVANNTDFGSVVLSDTRSQSFVIANTGTASLTVTSLTLTGVADFSLVNPTVLPWVLAVGNSQTISVGFTPTTTGLRSATLGINTKNTVNNNTGSTYTAALQGTGAVCSLTASIGGTLTVCAGQATNLTASGGMDYIWNTGATTATISATAGTYSVTVLSGVCSATTAVTVISIANPIIAISGNLTICAGQSTTLTATAGASYVWSNTQTSQSISVSAAGPYSVTVTAASGCSNTGTASVTVNALPVITLISSGTVTCANPTVTLTAGGGTSYTFSAGASQIGGSTGNTATVTAGGTYTVTVANANGCVSVTTTDVSSTTTAPIVTLTASNLVVCSPTTVTLTAGGGLSYTFSPGATQLGTTNQAVVTQSGTYSVTGSNLGGCTATSSISVTVNTPPGAPTLTSVSRTITQTNTPLPLEPFVNTIPGNTLSFSSVNGAMANPPTADVSQVGVQSFSVAQTDGKACTSVTTPFTLTIIAYPPANQSVCRSGSVVLTVGLSGVRYEWYKNGQSAPFRLTEIASIQKGTATASLTIVSAQTTATYYCKVFQTGGSFSFAGPFVVTVNYGCITAGARVNAASVAAEIPLSVVLMPNPVVKGQLRAVVRGAEGQPLMVELLDLRGMTRHQQQWAWAAPDQAVEWDVSGQPAGVYVLRVVSGSPGGPVQRQTLNVVKPD